MVMGRLYQALIIAVNESAYFVDRHFANDAEVLAFATGHQSNPVCRAFVLAHELMPKLVDAETELILLRRKVQS